MKEQYRETATTVSFIHYHFVFCSYRRRKIFDIPGLEDRFKQLTADICKELEVEILSFECDHDHVCLSVSALPQIAIPDLMARIKWPTSKILRDEFKELVYTSHVWTRNYLVTTDETLSKETINAYVNTQRSR